MGTGCKQNLHNFVSHTKGHRDHLYHLDNHHIHNTQLLAPLEAFLYQNQSDPRW